MSTIEMENENRGRENSISSVNTVDTSSKSYDSLTDLYERTISIERNSQNIQIGVKPTKRRKRDAQEQVSYSPQLNDMLQYLQQTNPLYNLDASNNLQMVNIE
uniref:Uncharacterized protein n=1 Tax=viral metagenome TaxID=1070528 RepID=A0A6C0C0Q5_9ZZZZ